MDDEYNQPKFLWAFAKSVNGVRPTRRQRRRDNTRRRLSNYCITVCSPRLKALGVRAGMRWSEAAKIAPNMRVVVL